MKKASDYIEKYIMLKEMKIVDVIRKAQIDAIDEAVKRCAESAETCLDSAWNTIIDEDSILKVAEQLRKEIENE